MKLKYFVLFIIIGLFVSTTICAHPGRTDSDGGHNETATSEYHYHHGYSAHQHTDGKCPYDYNDKTVSSTTSSSSDDSTYTYHKTKTNIPALLLCILVVVGPYLILPFLDKHKK